MVAKLGVSDCSSRQTPKRPYNLLFHGSQKIFHSYDLCLFGVDMASASNVAKVRTFEYCITALSLLDGESASPILVRAWSRWFKWSYQLGLKMSTSTM